MAKAHDTADTARPAQTRSAFVRRKLLEHLAANWEPQRRLPPISDLAEQYKVSVGTAQQAVRGLVAQGILVARRRVGTTLAPDCSRAALRRHLARDQSEHRAGDPAPELPPGVRDKRVLIIRPQDDDSMFTGISESCTRRLLQFGADVELVMRNRLDQQDDREAHWADAIVLVQPPGHVPDLWSPRQVVLTMGTLWSRLDRKGRYDQVTLDDEQGGFLAGRRLREAGCASVAFLGARPSPRAPTGEYHETAARRLRGFEHGWGAPIPPEFRLKVKSYNPVHGRTAAAVFARLPERPDGIFAASDDLAVGFVQAAPSVGLEPGRNCQIIGFDHQQMAEDLPGGPLTTIELPREEMGRRGAELLAQRLAHPDAPAQRVLLGCRVFEGATVRKMRAIGAS